MGRETDITKINEKSPYYDITAGNQILGGGGSVHFNTGEWRTKTPVMDWNKCTQCLLCTPCCPDSSIPVKDGKRQDFDYDHCKGCGICSKVCSFGAITMVDGVSPNGGV